jgi:hypothetical protein
MAVEGRGCLLSQGGEHGEEQTGWECGEHLLLRYVVGWWGGFAKGTRDEGRGYTGNTGEGDTHLYAGHLQSQGGWGQHRGCGQRAWLG